jgi:alcohol dehydrogenase (cytochrome c)
MSTAYNPATGLFYVMALESCNIYTKSSAWWQPGQSFYGGAARRVPGETNQKILRAIDVQTGKIAWEVPQIGVGHSAGGVLSTAGGVVFFADDNGALAAVDAKTGEGLWHFHTNEVATVIAGGDPMPAPGPAKGTPERNTFTRRTNPATNLRTLCLAW